VTTRENRAVFLDVDGVLAPWHRRHHALDAAAETARLRGIARWLGDHPEVTEWVSLDDDHQVAWLRTVADDARRSDDDRTWAHRLLLEQRRFLFCDWQVRSWTRTSGASASGSPSRQAWTPAAVAGRSPPSWRAVPATSTSA
jgi:hypothetical protein